MRPLMIGLRKGLQSSSARQKPWHTDGRQIERKSRRSTPAPALLRWPGHSGVLPSPGGASMAQGAAHDCLYYRDCRTDHRSDPRHQSSEMRLRAEP
jgi:hypothetical protein